MSGSRDTDRESFAQMLGECKEDAFVRAAVVATDAGWQLRHLWALIGAVPPGWDETAWLYEDVAFMSARVQPSLLRTLIDESERRSITLGGIAALVPPVYEVVPQERKPSYAQHDRPLLSMPTRRFTMSRSDTSSGGSQLPSGFLIASDAPSFTSAENAFRAFFEGDYSLHGAWSAPSELVHVRWADESAYLGPVHAAATQVIINVRGSAVAGAVLELFSDSHRDSVVLTGPGEVAFALEEGLPEQSWLWLKRDKGWLDYRALSTPWGAPNLDAAGVTIEPPVEPDDVVEAMIYGGEGPHLEFKRSLPTTADERRHAFKTVSAFANGEGGTILFGIDRDEMTVVGVDGKDAIKLRDQLAQMVRARVMPTPPFVVTAHSLNEKLVLKLEVQAGNSPPYAISVDSSSKDRPEFYVRRGANTYPAQPSDLREVVAPPEGAQPALRW